MEKLRFKDENGNNYKKSKLSDLGSLLVKTSTGLNPRKNFELGVGENFYVTIKNIKNRNLSFDKCEKISNEALKLIHKRSDIQSGDILMSSIGNIGESYLIKENPINWDINESVFMLRTNKEKLLPEYLISVLENNNTQKYFNKTKTGTTFQSIKFNQLKKLNLNLPEIEEQQKVANYFENLEIAINETQKEIKQVEKFKKDMLHKIFNQKIRFKDDNGNDYPDWEITKLSKISKSNIKNKELPETFIYVDLTSVKKGILVEEKELNKNNCPDAASYNLEKNDILIARVRPYQQNNYFIKEELKTKYIASNGFTHLRINKDQNPEFIYHLIHTKENLKYININSTGTTYPTISNKDLLNLNILLPCLEEQNKISELFSGIDSEILNLKNSLKSLNDLKKDMLEKMF